MYGLVRARHPVQKGWVVLSEVSDDGANGRADLVAVSCWGKPFVVVYELKASRADWLRELDTPAKRAWAERVGRFRWFVTEPACAKLEELPAGWGLMEVIGPRDRRRLRRIVAAPAMLVESMLSKWLCRCLLRGEERRLSLETEVAALRSVADGEAGRRELAEVVEARRELARERLALHDEKLAAEAFWREVSHLAGEKYWTSRARRDWTPHELLAAGERHAAQQILAHAQEAYRACEHLLSAAKAPEAEAQECASTEGAP